MTLGWPGRLYTYDVVGGRYEENDFGSTGSGASLAKSYLRANFTEGLTADEAVDVAVGALVSAAQEDTATGGPGPAARHLPDGGDHRCRGCAGALGRPRYGQLPRWRSSNIR